MEIIIYGLSIFLLVMFFIVGWSASCIKIRDKTIESLNATIFKCNKINNSKVMELRNEASAKDVDMLISAIKQSLIDDEVNTAIQNLHDTTNDASNFNNECIIDFLKLENDLLIKELKERISRCDDLKKKNKKLKRKLKGNE